MVPEILNIFVQSKLNQFEPSNLHDSEKIRYEHNMTTKNVHEYQVLL